MRAIVTTTIRKPTEAIERFAALPDWQLYVVGDLNTPHEVYSSYDGIKYLTPDYQRSKYPILSEMIGWNCIQRRNIGLLEAYEDGADIVATVDDDNIPYDSWGIDVLVGREVEIDCYENAKGIFDPLSVTNVDHLWHRGYPIELLNSRLENGKSGTIKSRVLVQADLWDGNPDIDAICRIINNDPVTKITGTFPFTCRGITVFNSQNTFLHRSVLSKYCVVPNVGRMDDIWGSIILQQEMKHLAPFIAFGKASVYQQRNEHSQIGDLEQEIVGYRNTLALINGPWQSVVGQKANDFYQCYTRAFR
jgi:hypothetical protein